MFQDGRKFFPRNFRRPELATVIHIETRRNVGVFRPFASLQHDVIAPRTERGSNTRKVQNSGS